MIGKARAYFTSSFWRTGERPWYGSLGVSTLFHLCLLALVASLAASPRGTDSPHGLDTRWAAPDVELALNIRVEEPKIEDPQPLPSAGGLPAVSIVFDERPAHSIVEPPLPLPLAAEPVKPPGPVKGKLVSRSNERGKQSAPASPKGTEKGTAKGKGEGDGQGDGKGIGFFGASDPGHSFVFVVDGSKSMNHPHPGEAKTRFGKLKLELAKSIGNMKSDMRFCIIFFNNRAKPMPGRRLQPATPENQDRFLKWAARIRADGRTDPRSAVLLALRLRPDVIYFLTDGNFSISSRAELGKLRQRQTRIHTIAFGTRDAEQLLKKIARRNGGNYRFIP